MTTKLMGQKVQRVEDQRFLRGLGRYADDLALGADTLHAAVLRSPHAHARITDIDVSDVLDLEGVHLVWTHDDLEGALGEPLPLLIPLEFFSNFLLRPFTLSIRLFANMFAGHFILLVFTLGGFVLASSSSLFIKPISVLSFVMVILMTFLELLVAALQAYVFALLSALYVQQSLSEEH